MLEFLHKSDNDSIKFADIQRISTCLPESIKFVQK